MAKLSKKQIQELARAAVKERPGGIRYAELVRLIAQDHPETPVNSVHGAVWDLADRFPSEVAKPSRGLLVPVPGADTLVPQEPIGATTATRLREETFYQPFADWLVNELDEATIALPLGGASLQKKWGTPDVVGVYKPLASHRIKFDVEILAAEIKVDPQTPVVAFGQAAAYRLFASKSYVVMPDSVSEEDYSRLEALCMLFGIGLVLFTCKTDEPSFRIRVRAQRVSPDMFYVNEFAERIFQTDSSVFNRLFG